MTTGRKIYPHLVKASSQLRASKKMSAESRDFSDPPGDRGNRQRHRVLFVFSIVVWLVAFIAVLKLPAIFVTYFNNKLGIRLSLAGLLAGVGVVDDDYYPFSTDDNGKTTVLLVGVDRGEGRFYTFNTDTIMTLTYDPGDHSAYMISYPRDLYVKVPYTRSVFDKINAMYYHGRVYYGDGIRALKEVIYEISGLKPQYYVIVDFDGFKELIDFVGGVDVYNPRAFVDHAYPRRGGGYMTVKFDKGWLHLDGERALQYARSRKAKGPEGSDFARAARQQRILEALLKELVNKLKRQPWLINEIIKIAQKNLEYSPIDLEELNYALKLYSAKGLPKFYSIVLNPSLGNGRLLKPYSMALYFIAPRHGLGNWYFVRLFIRDYLKYPEFITNLPSKAYIVNCADKIGTYQLEAKLLKYRLFYLPIKSIKSDKQCATVDKNVVIDVKESRLLDLENITGYLGRLGDSTDKTQSRVPKFLISSYSLE